MVREQGHELVDTIQLATRSCSTKAQTQNAFCFGRWKGSENDLYSQPSGLFPLARQEVHVAIPESRSAEHTDKSSTHHVELDLSLATKVSS